MTSGGLRPVVRLAAWTASLVVAARVLLSAGSASLAVPLTSLDDLAAWLAQAPPADLAMALLRLAGLAAVAYLLAVTALAVLARVSRLRGLAAAVDRVTPGVVRRVVAGGSGVGLVLGALVGSLPSPTVPAKPEPSTIAVASGATTVAATATAPTVAPMTRVPAGSATVARDPDTTATMTRVSPPAIPAAPEAAGATTAVVTAPEATMTRVDEPPEPSATMVRVDSADAASAGAITPRAAATPMAYEPPAPGGPAAPASPQIDPNAWIVEPGDSLWSIAQDVMSRPDGPAPGERLVRRYWRRMIEANRSRLVDPANPDLLVPGQDLVVPPPDG